MSRASKCTVVFVRRGDFYEHTAPQADDIAKVLGMTWTLDGSGTHRVGVPKHGLHYLDALVSAGYNVTLST